MLLTVIGHLQDSPIYYLVQKCIHMIAKLLLIIVIDTYI